MNENINTSNNNKKKLLIIIIATITIAAIICTANFILVEQDDTSKNSLKYENEEKNQSTSTSDDKEETPLVEEQPSIEEQPSETPEHNNIEQLSYESFNEMIKEKRSFVVLISQTYCSHCIEFKPIYNNAFENRISKGYELDILNLTTSQRTKILDQLGVDGTPTTLIFIDGKQQDRLEGTKTKEELKKFLDTYGFI